MYTLAILTMFSKHSSSLTIILKYFHEILLGPRADKLLHLSMVLVNKKDSTEMVVWLEVHLTTMHSLDNFVLNQTFDIELARDL